MPLKNIDFSKEVGRMADPLSPDGNLLSAAKQQEGQANAEYTTAVGGMVLAAGKGYMESRQETDIRKTIASYEARLKTDDAQLTLDLFESGITEGTPAEVSKAKEDIQKYKDALDQGIMTREQALLAIDKSVKDYSNTMPGWASDFRKQASTITGVEHMGNYSEASLLAKASASEKVRQDQLKFMQDIQQKQLTMYVEKYAVMPAGGLKGPEMARFREQLKLAADTTNLKVSLENKNLTIQQAEPRVVGYIQGRMADGMMTISNLMQGIVTGTDPKTGKPFPQESKVLFRQNILSQIGSFFEKTKAELLGFNTNQITEGTREQLMNRLNTQQKELVSSLEKQEAFDDFKKTMELNTAKAADIMNVWSIANPQLEIFRKSGMSTPELARFWLESQGDPKRAADFTKRMPAVDAYYRAVAGGGKGAADQHVRDMTGSSVDPEHMEALRKTNPGAYQTSLHQLQNHIKEIILTGWGETPEVIDARKKDFAKNLEVFSSQVRMNDVSTMREWTKLTSDPRLAQRIKELPQPAQAIMPIVNKTRDVIENPEMGLMARVLSLYKKVSATHKDVGFELTVDALDQVGVKYFPWKGQAGLREKAPIYGDGGQIGDDGPELRKYISMLNGSLATLNNFQETIPEELRGKLAKDLVTKFNTGYFNLPIEQRMGTGMSSLDTRSEKGLGFLGELKRPDGKVSTEISVDVSIGGKEIAIPTLVPGLTKDEINTLLTTNTAREIPESILSKAVAHAKQRIAEGKSPFAGPGESGVDPDKTKAAIIHAEGSNVNAGLSPKGALGMFQFMETTAKAYGLKIDKALGIDERLDPVKAGEAAVALITKLHKQFDGDLSKVAAAYNAGEGNVRKAEAKAEKAGVPGMWVAFLPKPGETGPYIARFLQKYKGE